MECHLAPSAMASLQLWEKSFSNPSADSATGPHLFLYRELLGFCQDRETGICSALGKQNRMGSVGF